MAPRGPLAAALAASATLRFLYTLAAFLPIAAVTLLASLCGNAARLVPLWHAFAFATGLTCVVHGAPAATRPPPLVVANHFTWMDWPLLQAAFPYPLVAVVKVRASVQLAGGAHTCQRAPARTHARADVALLHTRHQADLSADSVIGWVFGAWSRNLGAIPHTRGDKASGAVRLAAYPPPQPPPRAL